MRFMLCSMLVAVASVLGEGAALAAPRLEGDKADLQCRQTLQLAKFAFDSTNPGLNFPGEAPKGSGGVFAIRQVKADSSGQDALSADPASFSAKPFSFLSETPGWLFWQTKAAHGLRIVVLDTPFNWKGDWFYTYVVDEAVDPEAVARDAQQPEPTKRLFKPLLGDGRWSAPLVLKDRASESVWIVDMGQPFQVFQDWKVYIVGSGGAQSPCAVSFRSGEAVGLSLLPAPVRRLAASLDDALGPGLNEGTAQFTAATRNFVSHQWADASLRPWALSVAPYNTRDQVEAGLREWAAKVRSRGAVYRAIQRQTPDAEKAMTAYYSSRFRLSAVQSQAMGRYVIDHMIRDYFTFPSNGKSQSLPVENPWPTGVR